MWGMWNTLFWRVMMLAVLGAVCLGVIFLQVYLCRRKYSLWGMILPILAFLFMLDRSHISLWNLARESWAHRLIVCGPTIVLILVYYLCRGRVKRRRELKRMNIQDLE